MTTHELQVHLLDYLKTVIILLDAESKISFINAEAEALFKVSSNRVQGEKITCLFSEPESTSENQAIYIDSSSNYTKRETPVTLHDGSQITIDYAVTPFPYNKEETYTIIEIQPMDRLLRISRDEDIISSQQKNRDLVRGLAHEIKNPLGGLRGAAQLLTKELKEPHLRDYTSIIIQEADRLRDLVDRLLGPDKLPTKETINIHEVLEHVYSLMKAEIGDSILITRDYDPSIPNLDADKTQLIQAVLNIARNAVQVLQSNPPENRKPAIILRSRTLRQFTIGTQRHRLVCKIEIIDNGPGIPDELKDRLFLPMISGRPDGTGLGLSIAQSIINRHNGLIECISAPQETIFSLYIPLEQQP